MILGCHDLSIFNLRSITAKGWRKKISKEFQDLASIEKPVCMLHHPHNSVKIRTWLNAWINIKKLLPSVQMYAGNGRLYETGTIKDPQDEVLKKTRCGNSIDFVVLGHK